MRLSSGEGRTGNRNDRSKDASSAPKKPKSEQLRELWPDIWALVKPRRGLLLLGLLLIIISRVCGLVLPYSTKYLIDNVVTNRQVYLLPRLTLYVLGATAVQGVTAFILTQLLSIEGQRLIAELRRKVQSHIGRLPVTYFDANKSGQLVSRIMSDVEGIRNLIGTGLVDFVGGILTAVISLIVLLRMNAPMTVLALTIVLAFGVTLSRAFRTIRPIFRERGKLNAEVTGRLTESLSGVRVIKGYHAEDREARVFGEGVQRLLDNVRKSMTVMSVMSLAATVLMGVVGAIIKYMGANAMLSPGVGSPVHSYVVMSIGTHAILGNSMTPGDYFRFVAFLAALVEPIVSVVNIGTQLYEAIAGLERTRQVMAEHPEDEDPTRTHAIATIRGEVIFDNVTFAYNPDRDVLHSIAFTSSPGTVTAFVGPSGSGKSTTIGLISAFYKPTGGHIFVDGIDLDTVQLPSFRGQLGVVLQETFLFDGTIRDNVVFSRPHATEEEFLSACRIARVDEFAEKLEQGYDTIVGERGVKLSGGQRQRLSIARAILADPRILILDEATSSLDSESEAMIQEGLTHLMKGRTTFVIAHRLSTIRRAHQILVVEDGRIVERGTHSQLFALRGRYWDMYTRQHALDDNLFLALVRRRLRPRTRRDRPRKVTGVDPRNHIVSRDGTRALSSDRAVLLLATTFLLITTALSGILPLWLDEIIQLRETRNTTPTQLIASLPDQPGAAPLGYLIQQTTLRITGYSVRSARFPSALSLAATVLIVCLFAAELGLTRPWLAGSIFALFPITVRYACESRVYSQAIFFSSLATLLFVRLVKNPTWLRTALYCLALMAAVYTQPYAIFIGLAHIAWAVSCRDRKAAASSILSFVLADAAFLPWYLWTRSAWSSGVTGANLHFILTAKTPLMLFRELAGAGYWGSGLLLILCALSLTKRSYNQTLLALLIALPILLALAADAAFGYFIATRQILWVLPAVAVFAAWGIERRPRLAVPIGFLLVALCLVQNYRFFTSPHEDWGLAADALASEVSHGACLIVVPTEQRYSYEFFRPSLASSPCPANRTVVAVTPYATNAQRETAFATLISHGYSRQSMTEAGKSGIAVFTQ